MELCGIDTRAARARMLALMAVAVLLASACRTEGLSFLRDERAEIVYPEEHATVTLPFTLKWTVEDFEITGRDGRASPDAGYFAVFLDLSPIPPSEQLSYVARDDEACVRSPDCPSEAYLNERNIFTTTATSLEVVSLADTRPPDRPSARDSHEITIIFLNGRGERIGEGAFSVEFTVDRGRG